MASLLVGALPIPSNTLSRSARLSFSQSQTISTSLPSFAPALSLSAAPSPSLPSVYCGRGDRKTERGKRFSHSFGNARPRNKNKGRGPPRAPMPPSSAPRKDKFDKDDIIKIEIDDSFSNS